MNTAKIKIPKQITWDHHRSGWKYAISCLQELNNPNGILFEGYIDGTYEKHLNQPWVGFLHGTPRHPQDAERKYRRIKSVGEILATDIWKQNKEQCLGIFTVSEYLAAFIRTKTDVPVCSLIHPTQIPNTRFQFDLFQNNPKKRVIIVGHWMRKFTSLFQLQTSMERCILRSGHSAEQVDLDFLKEQVNIEEVTILEHTSDEDYDQLLSQNIVFLDLHDVAANNGIIDCIARNTPCLVNRLAGAIDYLGEDYPFFYSNLNEAAQKLRDLSLIKQTSEYLHALPIKEQMTGSLFRNSLESSSIYQALPLRRVML